MAFIPSNTLYYGDNLAILREHIADESVDLIYLDPPFNSKRDYNLLFREARGGDSASQIKAFGDTWSYGEETERMRDEVAHYAPRYGVEKLPMMLDGFLDVLGKNDVTAHLIMMAVRVLELHRVLKPTGSFYLHCDPTASHYLKIMLDVVFGKENFRNEIVWQRTSSHNDASQGLTRLGRIHDLIFFYAKSLKPVWNIQHVPYDESYLRQHYSNIEENTGRRYKTSDLTAARGGGDTSYDWKGAKPPLRTLLGLFEGKYGEV